VIDKRRFHRWPCSIPCRCKTEREILDAVLIDISYDGARLDKAHRLPAEGCEVELTLHLPDDDLQMRARIVYSRPDFPQPRNQFGIQFYGSEEEKQRKLLPIYQKYLADGVPA